MAKEYSTHRADGSSEGIKTIAHTELMAVAKESRQTWSLSVAKNIKSEF